MKNSFTSLKLHCFPLILSSPSPWQLPGTLCSLPVRGTPPPLSRVARASPWVAGGGVLTRILPVGARD